MKMVEQNISGVKLERLRQNAVKKHKILRKLFPVCLILFIGLTLVKNRFLFASISEYGWGDPATQGAFWMLVGNLMLSVIFAGAIFVFYYMLVYKKAYDLFCINFKNKYVLDTLRQLPDFSELRYNAGGGLSYEDMNRLKLIPGGQSVFYQSSDELSGKLDGVPFRAVNVCTGEKASARSSTPKILFEGQVIVFSCFDNRKISEGFVQVFSKKALSKLRETRVPLPIQTENSVFNENFAVFAENEQRKFSSEPDKAVRNKKAVPERRRVSYGMHDCVRYPACYWNRHPRLSDGGYDGFYRPGRYFSYRAWSCRYSVSCLPVEAAAEKRQPAVTHPALDECCRFHPDCSQPTHEFLSDGGFPVQ